MHDKDLIPKVRKVVFFETFEDYSLSKGNVLFIGNKEEVWRPVETRSDVDVKIINEELN